MNRVVIAVLLVFQTLCAGVYLYDILSGLVGFRTKPISWALYELIQIGAGLGLILGVVVTGILLARSVRAQRRAEASLRMASGAFMQVIAEHFDEWQLTPAERDVALFAIKGLSTAEIAALRNTSEGTVKAQTNAIYRKAGVSGRSQLLSLFIDELMGDGLAENGRLSA
ncbi:MAG: LuxR C-terminal-related transcriptional regulator [Paracoccaceae bacterium]|nr:LuxR C-terminal-related transcriptional regulator [Paracoccaceae bacterium]